VAFVALVAGTMSSPRGLLRLAAGLAAVPGALAGVYSNPVSGPDTPDPGVAFDPATRRWWAATTTGDAPGGSYALRSSPDLATWTPRGFLYPSFPSWAVNSCWAPELHLVAGRWLAVYVGRERATGLLAIGVGVSTTDSPAGPWADSGAPLVLDASAAPQGQIDPTLAFDDDGTPVLVFKEDGNADGRPTPIHYARLVPNGTALAPASARGQWKGTELFRESEPWEGALVEAPWLVRRPDAWYAFYSGNGFGADYAVGVARSPTLTGAYTKLGPPILSQGGASPRPFEAPGHCSVVTTPAGDSAIVYHAYLGDDRSGRKLMLDAIAWDAVTGWPAVLGGPGGTPSGGGFVPATA